MSQSLPSRKRAADEPAEGEAIRLKYELVSRAITAEHPFLGATSPNQPFDPNFIAQITSNKDQFTEYTGIIIQAEGVSDEEVSEGSFGNEDSDGEGEEIFVIGYNDSKSYTFSSISQLCMVINNFNRGITARVDHERLILSSKNQFKVYEGTFSVKIDDTDDTDYWTKSNTEHSNSITQDLWPATVTEIDILGLEISAQSSPS